MSIRFGPNGAMSLDGDCPADDADLLLQHLLRHPDATVEWGGCRAAHTAVVQVLLAAGRVPGGTPKGMFLRSVIGPALERALAASSAFPGRQGDAK